MSATQRSVYAVLYTLEWHRYVYNADNCACQGLGGEGETDNDLTGSSFSGLPWDPSDL